MSANTKDVCHAELVSVTAKINETDGAIASINSRLQVLGASIAANFIGSMATQTLAKVMLDVESEFGNEIATLGTAAKDADKETVRRRQNYRAILRAAIVCNLAANTKITGGKGAEDKELVAKDLTANQMKERVSDVRKAVEAEENKKAMAVLTPEELATAKAKAETDAAKRAEDIAAQNKANAELADKELVAEFLNRMSLFSAENMDAFKLGLSQRGLKLAKDTSAPKKGGLADLATMMTK